MTTQEKRHAYYLDHKDAYRERTRRWRAKRRKELGAPYTTLYSRKWSADPKNRETLRAAWRRHDKKMRELMPGWKGEIHRRYRIRHADRIKANNLVSYAIKLGQIKPKPCEICGKKKPNRIEAHHPDYSKPFAVRWLCVPHHKMQHHTSSKRVSFAQTRQDS